LGSSSFQLVSKRAVSKHASSLVSDMCRMTSHCVFVCVSCHCCNVYDSILLTGKEVVWLLSEIIRFSIALSIFNCVLLYILLIIVTFS